MKGIICAHTFIPNSMGIITQALAQHGYITTIMDTRGTGGRGKVFRDVVYGKVGDPELADQVYALKQLSATRPYMDLNRVGVLGGSFGGFMSVRAMLKYPNMYKVGVARAPVIDLRRHPNVSFMGPENSVDGYDYKTNIELADQLQGKLLIIHGTADEAIPFGEVMRLTDAFIKANKHFDLVIMPNETHDSENLWNGYGQDALVRYFLEHLNP
jgi:dipeptidyl aminopeptidase/acylaminoacyl peptidase